MSTLWLKSASLVLASTQKGQRFTMGLLIYNFIIVYSVAAGIVSSLTELLKRLIPLPRPHFLDTCKPNIAVGNCTGYVTEYECQGTDKKALDDMFLSFPSGHTSLTFVATTYTWLYLQERLHLKYSPMVRPTIQTVYACFGFYIVCTRITDNKHHLPDILAGSLIGIFCAIT
ncbi:PAP2 family protein, partial [Opisthorchis viverrini]